MGVLEGLDQKLSVSKAVVVTEQTPYYIPLSPFSGVNYICM